jgi:hypothetical protein
VDRRVTHSLTTLIETSIDAVYIPLPADLHYEWAIKALLRGKHVIAEKLVTANTAEADMLFRSPLLVQPKAPILLPVITFASVTKFPMLDIIVSHNERRMEHANIPMDQTKWLVQEISIKDFLIFPCWHRIDVVDACIY